MQNLAVDEELLKLFRAGRVTPGKESQGVDEETMRLFKASRVSEASANPSGVYNPYPDFQNNALSQYDNEAMFNFVKANPQGPEGRGYSDDEIDRALEYMAEKGIEPGKILPAAVTGFVDTLGIIGEGLLSIGGSTIDRAGKVLNPRSGANVVDDFAAPVAAEIAEGVLRGGSDLGILGAEAMLKNKLMTNSVEREYPTDQIMFARTQPELKVIKYRDFQEEDKTELRKAFRTLLDSKATRSNLEKSILADVTAAISGNHELGDRIQNLIIPENAELYSLVAGPEGAAAKLSSKVAKSGGKSLITQAEQGALGAIEGTARASGQLLEAIPSKVDALKETLPTAVVQGVKATGKVLDTLPGSDIVKKALDPKGKDKFLQQVANDIGAFRRQTGVISDQNLLGRVARDPALSNTSRQVANFLANGTDSMGVLGPIVSELGSFATFSAATARGGLRGGFAGGLMALPTLDGEIIGGAIGSAMASAGVLEGGVRGKRTIGDTVGGFFEGADQTSIFGNRAKVSKAAAEFETTIPDFAVKRLKERGFTEDQMVRNHVYKRFAQGMARGLTGAQDVIPLFTDSKRINEAVRLIQEDQLNVDTSTIDSLQSELEQKTRNKEGHTYISETRGVQLLNTRVGKPVVLFNVDTMSPTTIIHEMTHALDAFGDYQPQLDEARRVLFDTEIEGQVVNKGILSESDLLDVYEQYTVKLGAEGRQRIEDHIAQNVNKAAKGTPQVNADYHRVSIAKKEVLADAFESVLEGRDPLYLERLGLQKFVREGARSIARHLNVMSKFAAMTAPAEVFNSRQGFRKENTPIHYPAKELLSAIDQINRARRTLELARDEAGMRTKTISRPELLESGEGIIVDPSEITRDNQALVDAMAGSSLVKVGPDGEPVFDSKGRLTLVESAAELGKIEKKRVKEFARLVNVVTNDVKGMTRDGPAHMDPVRVRELDNGKTEISGDYINEDLMQALENADPELFPRAWRNNLRTLNDFLKSGELAIIDYNPRLEGRSNKQRYSSKLGSTKRLVAPYAVRMTGAGNIIVQTIGMDHLLAKYDRTMRDAKRKEPLVNLWGNNQNAFLADLSKYVGNTLSGKPDGADGLSRQKANVLSAFMGFDKKMIDFINNGQGGAQRDLLRQLNPDKGKDNLIRSRRLDAINSVRRAPTEEIYNFSASGRALIQRNFEPDSSKPSEAKSASELEAGIKKKHGDKIDSINVTEGDEYIQLMNIRVNKDYRGTGIGKQAIDDIKEYSGKTQKPIVLSIQPDKGKLSALERFYRENGFVRPGKRKDYSLPRHTHVYYPNKRAELRFDPGPMGGPDSGAVKPKSGETKKVPFVLSENGIPLTHRRKRKLSSLSETGYVVLFAEDGNNINYGEHAWALKDQLPEVPEDVIAFAEEFFEIDRDEAIEAVNPDNIIDSAGAWDNSQFVFELWNAMENGSVKEEKGFMTPDGAVILDPLSANLEYVFGDEDAVMGLLEDGSDSKSGE